MLTKGDIKKLLEVFATKQELAELRAEMATKDQLNGVMDKLDAVYAEVKDVRQEQTVHWGQHQDLRKEIESIEGRVEKIEQAL